MDMFLFPHSYVDLASIGKIPGATGGTVQRYPMFRADVDGERFIQVCVCTVFEILGVHFNAFLCICLHLT